MWNTVKNNLVMFLSIFVLNIFFIALGFILNLNAWTYFGILLILGEILIAWLYSKITQ
jgi:hypothetical protein